MDTWGGDLDDNTWQASINNYAYDEETYRVDQFYNGVGTINQVSSTRIIGHRCNINFKNIGGDIVCTLSAGSYDKSQFQSNNNCGVDVIIFYTVELTGT